MSEAKASQVQAPQPTPMTAQEYAKISAIKERIRGLRSGMWAAGAVAGILSAIVFLSVYINEYSTSAALALRDALTYGIFTIIPFMAVVGYLQYRVNKHITRLSAGKFERRRRPVEEDYD